MSLQTRLAPRIVVPLYERLSGRRPWTELRRLRELQWRTPEELEARALAKLRPLLAHAYAHVPYYRDLFARSGIRPDDILTMADLSRLPLTGKADLRANFPDGVVADNLPARRRYKTSTSGSTGFPFEFYTDRAGADIALGSYLLFREWAGVAVGDAMVYITTGVHSSAGTAGSSRFTRALRQVALGERVVLLSGIELRAGELRARLGGLRPGSPYVIWGWPSSTARIAVELLEQRAELPTYPKAVITSNETLTAAGAAAIERAFRCRVANHYSSYEVLHLAQTCPDNPPLLHVNSERAIVRVVREDGSAAAPGESGRVVMTDPANWVMPFVNYDIGDRARAGARCPCGRGFPTLMSLEGRSGEAIRTLAGKTISPAALGWLLTGVLRALPSIREYQAVQTAADAVVLRIVPTSSHTSEFGQKLRGELERLLGSGMDVTVETVDRIAVETSGKRLVIKSELPSQPSPWTLPEAEGGRG